MHNFQIKRFNVALSTFAPLSLTALLVACGGSNNYEPPVTTMAQYQVSITNGSAKQLLAPAAVLLNTQPVNLWAIGSPASAALEQLAESGSPDALLASVLASDSASAGPTPAGASNAVILSLPASMPAYISFASMPVYTNDGFVGLQNIDVSSLMLGESMHMAVPVYDAGTEANTESLNTLPGPDVGGEGFDAERDDIHNYVTRHAGVVSFDGGLTTSVLDESYRFDSGSFYLKVTRTQ